LEQLDSIKPMEHSKESFIESIKTDDEFAKIWGELGPIYGKQWRNWESVDTSQFWQEDWSPKDTDQIQNLINELKTNPDSRRLMVNAWNVGELDRMVLPPCHYGFQVYTRELSIEERLDLASKTYRVFDPFDFYVGDHNEIDKLYPVPKRAISLMWNQRSVDTFLGLPFNIASYALLLEIIAKEVNMVPDELIGNLGDVHLYSNHIEQAKEQINREPFKNLPTLKLSPIQLAHFEHHMDSFEDHIKESQPHQFMLDGYEYHPPIKAPLSN
jgi:thymidylate synthase